MILLFFLVALHIIFCPPENISGNKHTSPLPDLIMQQLPESIGHFPEVLLKHAAVVEDKKGQVEQKGAAHKE